MRHAKWLPLLAAVLLAACAQSPARDGAERHAHAAIDYAKYVQTTVPWFHFSSLYSWDSNQPGHVVVWTSPTQAYRLTLVGPCLGLDRSVGVIGLTSRNGMVSANRDAVLAGGDRCSIMQIQRLDAKALREAQSKTGSSGDKGG